LTSVIFNIEKTRRTSENDIRVYRFEEGPSDVYLSLIEMLSKMGYQLKPPFSAVKLPGVENELQIRSVLPYWIALRVIGKIRESEKHKAVKFFDKMITDLVETLKEEQPHRTIGKRVSF
jgi:hypothetical protein